MNLDKALAIEQKYHLNDLNIYGYHYWTIFRFPMIQAFHTVVDGTGQEHHVRPETLSARLHSYVEHTFNIFHLNIIDISRQIIYLCQVHVEYLTEENMRILLSIQ